LPVIDPKYLRPLHGGARTGAGRKSSGNVQVLLRLSPATAKRSHVTLSEAAEQHLALLR